MSIRQTSIDCYNQIKAEGLLSKRRLEVYEALYKNAPCTTNEALKDIFISDGNYRSNEGSRTTELRDLGVIYERGIKKCSITGRNVIEWDLTDKLPISNKVTTNTKKDRIENTLNALRELFKNKSDSTDEDWKKVADLIKCI
jgi:hypothetical protein